MMLEEDIIKAQKIVLGTDYNINNDCYHNSSFVYKTTNENIREYSNYLKNRRKIFSITASGDQVLNSILYGSKQIDACDISRFPNYFLELKRSSILNLSREDFIKFFITRSDKGEEFSDEYYDIVRESLNSDNKKFWDSLFGFFEGSDIYNSYLFSHEFYSFRTYLDRNPYLELDNYKLLQKKIEDVSINYLHEDLNNRNILFDDSYDLVNLSSIIYYGELAKLNNYNDRVKSFNLCDDGVVLTYIYNYDNMLEKTRNNSDYTFVNFNDNEGVMVYQKK
ncbi:MAG: DUF3419 family protein [bacterium]|nr:DUF3419 family protein [bacterium]